MSTWGNRVGVERRDDADDEFEHKGRQDEGQEALVVLELIDFFHHDDGLTGSAVDELTGLLTMHLDKQYPILRITFDRTVQILRFSGSADANTRSGFPKAPYRRANRIKTRS